MKSLDSILEEDYSHLRGWAAITLGEPDSPFEDSEVVLPSTVKNLYERLGLEDFSGDLSDIKNGYRRQAFAWHPDRHADEYKARAEEEFKAVDEAFQTLSDLKTRLRYDLGLRREQSQANKKMSLQASERFITPNEVDTFLTTEQAAQADYIDSLVGDGEIFVRIYKGNQDGGKQKCGQCDFHYQLGTVKIGYRGSEVGLPEKTVHNLLTHGARAVVAAELNEGFASTTEYAFELVGAIAHKLGIETKS